MEKISEINTITAYKALDENFCCRGFQYEVGKSYHEDYEIELCRNGFHACRNPLEVLSYDYEMSTSRFAEVELWGDVDECVSMVSCASDIKIIRELSLKELIILGYEFASNNKSVYSNNTDNRYMENILSISANDEISSRGANNTITVNGSSSRVSSIGEYTKIFSKGMDSLVSQLGHNGVVSLLDSDIRAFSCGYRSKVAILGGYNKVDSSGSESELVSFGYNNILCSSGNDSKALSNGEKCIVVSVGAMSKAKAKKGNWITLAEWKYKDGDMFPINVKTEYVDGERIKGDTWYKLEYGEFTETNP